MDGCLFVGLFNYLRGVEGGCGEVRGWESPCGWGVSVAVGCGLSGSGGRPPVAVRMSGCP